MPYDFAIECLRVAGLAKSLDIGAQPSCGHRIHLGEAGIGDVEDAFLAAPGTAGGFHASSERVIGVGGGGVHVSILFSASDGGWDAPGPLARRVHSNFNGASALPDA